MFPCPLLSFGTVGEFHAHCTHLQIAHSDPQTKICKRVQLIHPPLNNMQSANTNIELKELSITENIDKITLLVCTQNKLTDLQKILNFKNKNTNFLSLEYSNSAVNQKLLSICEKYENRIESNTIDLINNEIQDEEQEIVQNTPNYTIEFLCDIENLGIRGYNACKYFNLLTLKDLIDFYNANGNFLKVRNCGKKSNKELITICEKCHKIIHKNKI